jgi:hypothetical protein
LAEVKASTIPNRKKKGSKKPQEDTRTSRSYNTKQAYPEKPEQSPGTQHTQCQGKEIFASNSVEQKYERKDQAMKKLTTRSKYSYHQKKLLVDGLQEKYPLPLSSSSAWKHK